MRPQPGGTSKKEYKIQDYLGSTRVVLDGYGGIISQSDYKPYGELSWQSGQAQRLSWIGKEKDKESGLSDFGVRKYGDGRFTSIDPLWEKHRSLTPYHYALNNPLRYVDPTGLDSAQRSQAIEKANEYIGSGSTYKLGAKGEPGQKVDCSGLVSKSIIAGGEADPVTRNDLAGTGVQKIEQGSEEVETNNVEPGNAVSFRTGGSWGFHIGLVTDVQKDQNGTVTDVTVIHSSSRAKGPTEQTLHIGATRGLASMIHGFWKWDTVPDVPKSAPLITPTVTTPNPPAQSATATVSTVKE